VEQSNAVRVATARRGEILGAALDAFAAHGVAGTSIEEIRRRSGASVGSIYHHFPGGKDAIAGALYVEGLRNYQDGFVEVLRQAHSTRAGVEGAVEHHLDWIAENPDLTRFILLGRDARVVVASERPLRDINRRFFTAVRNWAAPRVVAGELRDLPPELATALWIGPSQDFARYWLAGQSHTAPQAASPVLAAAAWRALRADEEPNP
jgi:AcrR family transcriptional regulator